MNLWQLHHKVSELVQTDLDANIARMKVGHVIVGVTKAAGGGFALAIQIAFYDQKPQKLDDPDALKPLTR